MPVRVADRDVRAGGVVALVDRQDPLGREPVDRRQDGRVDELAVGQREEVEAVVDHVELVGALEGMRDVEAFDDLGLDVRILRVAASDHRGEPAGGDRVGGREEGHVDAPRDEPLGEERCELLPRPVVARRHAPRHRREHCDPQGRHRVSSAETSRAPATIASSLPSARSRGRYFIPQSGATIEPLRRQHLERPPDPRRDDIRRLDLGRAEVEHAEHDRLVRQRAQQRRIEVAAARPRARCASRAIGELGAGTGSPAAGRGRCGRSRSTCAGRSSPSIPSRARLIASSAYSRAFSGRACRYGSSIWTTSAPAAFRSRSSSLTAVGIGEREAPVVGVVVVLCLLGHRERAGDRDLDPPVGDRRGGTRRRGSPPAAFAAPARRRAGPDSRDRCGRARRRALSMSTPSSAVAKRFE